ncbi:MAG: hypothetical protein IPF66_05195 [Holophagales bacterium]|nr:hypothetical protein [Holophagales bacterium]
MARKVRVKGSARPSRMRGAPIGALAPGRPRARRAQGRARPALRIYGVADGLKYSQVFCVAQDRDGMIWVGTSYGVSRYDGRKFESLTSREGLPHDSVSALATAADGTVWAATQEGLARIAPAAGALGEPRVVPLPPAIRGIASLRPTLLAASPGALWLGDGKRVVRVAEGRADEMPFPAGFGPNVLALGPATDDTCWAGSERGLALLSTSESNPTVLPIPPGRGSPVAFALDRGDLFVLLRRGLARLAGGTGPFQVVVEIPPEAGPNALLRLVDGWAIPTEARGLLLVREGRAPEWIGTQQGLPSASISGAIVDRSGILWLATEAGLVKVFDLDLRSIPIPASRPRRDGLHGGAGAGGTPLGRSHGRGLRRQRRHGPPDRARRLGSRGMDDSPDGGRVLPRRDAARSHPRVAGGGPAVPGPSPGRPGPGLRPGAWCGRHRVGHDGGRRRPILVGRADEEAPRSDTDDGDRGRAFRRGARDRGRGRRDRLDRDRWTGRHPLGRRALHADRIRSRPFERVQPRGPADARRPSHRHGPGSLPARGRAGAARRRRQSGPGRPVDRGARGSGWRPLGRDVVLPLPREGRRRRGAARHGDRPRRGEHDGGVVPGATARRPSRRRHGRRPLAARCGTAAAGSPAPGDRDRRRGRRLRTGRPSRARGGRRRGFDHVRAQVSFLLLRGKDALLGTPPSAGERVLASPSRASRALRGARPRPIHARGSGLRLVRPPKPAAGPLPLHGRAAVVGDVVGEGSDARPPPGRGGDGRAPANDGPQPASRRARVARGGAYAGADRDEWAAGGGAGPDRPAAREPAGGAARPGLVGLDGRGGDGASAGCSLGRRLRVRRRGKHDAAGGRGRSGADAIRRGGRRAGGVPVARRGCPLPGARRERRAAGRRRGPRGSHVGRVPTAAPRRFRPPAGRRPRDPDRAAAARRGRVGARNGAGGDEEPRCRSRGRLPALPAGLLGGRAVSR